MKKINILIFKNILIFISLFEIMYSQNNLSGEWDTVFNWKNSPDLNVKKIIEDKGMLFLAGNFKTIGNEIDAQYVVKFDGKNWIQTFYPGLFPLAMEKHDGKLYVTNEDTRVIYILDGTTWTGLSSGDGSYLGFLNCMAFKGNDMFFGGRINAIGGIIFHNVSRYSDGIFYNVNGGFYSYYGGICSILVKGDDVYFGGNISFSYNDLTLMNHIARYDGNSFYPLKNGLISYQDIRREGFGPVNTIVMKDSNLIVGGSFSGDGEKSLNNIALWNGKDWYPLGEGTDGCVKTIVIRDNEIYVGGRFTKAGGKDAKNIAMWDGKEWHAFGSGLYITNFSDSPPVGGDEMVYTLCLSGEYLYAGGNFNTAGGKQSYYIARWRFPTVGVESIKLPNEFKLNQNYPNPFNPKTVISYQLSVLSFVKLNVYDVLGREISTLVSEYKPAGNYSVEFDGSKLSSGTYLYRLEVTPSNGEKKITTLKAMVLMK